MLLIRNPPTKKRNTFPLPMSYIFLKIAKLKVLWEVIDISSERCNHCAINIELFDLTSFLSLSFVYAIPHAPLTFHFYFKLQKQKTWL